MMLPPSAGVIGWPVAHSKSPIIHRFWLNKLGLDGDYGRFPVHPDNLGTAIRALPALGLRGVNVTIPHKVTTMAHLDAVDPLCTRAGAVNTVVVNTDGSLSGYNTDVIGVAEPLRALGVPRQAYPNHVATYVQIIGAGGAARAAIVGAIAAGYGDFEIFARSTEKAKPLAELAGAPFGEALPLGRLRPTRNDDDGRDDQRYSHVVINATSMGMVGNDPVQIDLTHYYPDTIVFDMVYAPLETPLLAAARARGLRTIDGLQMLVAQAAAAFELFYGVAAPRGHDDELRAILVNA
ncbi:MAG: shikimate dehydrogenase [Polymorphobacter sp.]